MRGADMGGPKFIVAGNTANAGDADAMYCVLPMKSRAFVQMASGQVVQPVAAQLATDSKIQSATGHIVQTESAQTVAREDTCPLVNVRRTRRRRNESGKTVPKNCGIYFASDGISFTRRLAMKNATVAEVYLGKTGCKSPLDILPFDEDKLPYAMKEA